MKEQKKLQKGKFAVSSGLSRADCNDGRIFDHWADTHAVVTNPNGSKYWTEPKQGCIGSCWFIAALVSVAQVANGRLNVHPNYRFYDTITGAWGDWFRMANNQLPVDNSGNLVYARSTSLYIWPCLYEKAYAVWKEGTPTPTYASLAGGRADNALQAITGGVLGPSRTMPAFDGLGTPRRPAVASTNANAGGTLRPNHDYSIVRRINNQTFTLRDPCSCGSVNVTTAELNNYFVEWRYITV